MSRGRGEGEGEEGGGFRADREGRLEGGGMN